MAETRVTNARSLRRSSTEAESLLWSRLRRRELAGAKFRREHPVGPYIVDFYCHGRTLAIEIDGAQHYSSEQASLDEQRRGLLESQGVRTLRFSNLEVLRELEAVLARILNELQPSA